jgi:hypothetical protein
MFCTESSIVHEKNETLLFVSETIVQIPGIVCTTMCFKENQAKSIMRSEHVC